MYIKVSNRDLSYELSFDGKFTLLTDDSGTGKTTLFKNVQRISGTMQKT